jgi:hypothetical protein
MWLNRITKIEKWLPAACILAIQFLAVRASGVKVNILGCCD